MKKAVESPDGEFSKSGIGYGYAVSGRKEEALKVVAELQLVRAKGMAMAYHIALI